MRTAPGDKAEATPGAGPPPVRWNAITLTVMHARMARLPGEIAGPRPDPETLAGLAMKVHFNATAPVKPTEDQYRHIIAEALG